MRYRDIHYRWEWDLKGDPVSLWPLIADTNQFNHDCDLPPVEILPADDETMPGRVKMRLRHRRLTFEWIEEPFEWVCPHRFGVVRRYTRGPLAELRVRVDIEPGAQGGSHVLYQLWVRPASLLGRLIVPIEIGWKAGCNFDRTFRLYDELATGQVEPFEARLDVELAPGSRQRLAAGREALVARGVEPDLVDRLLATIEKADDLMLSRLRPYVLADRWGAERRGVLEACLLATRVGILDLKWDLICPLCRGAKEKSGSLANVTRQVHCESCNIHFDVNFERSVELTFHPNAAVRRVDSQNFCIGGPMVTPHIAVQQLVDPGAEKIAEPQLTEGKYRLRILGVPGGRFIRVDPSGRHEIRFEVPSGDWPAAEESIAGAPRLSFVNPTGAPHLFIVERMTWSDQAASALEVTTMQLFRDLFASESLRPGEEISVGGMAILFTDLKSSTRLYREIGDAPAFGAVMRHFDVLRAAVAAEGGAVVKTIGDAVMAAFPLPVAALRAVLAAQARLARPEGPSSGEQGSAPPPSRRSLRLKAGIHHGPCIAVTLNDRLDYFGSTVNAAARLVDLSSGDDIVVSAEVRSDPGVAGFLAQGGFQVAPIVAQLKGFEDDRFELYRVMPPAG